MSKVQLQGNVSGTGVFTIASPNSNTDRTLTLPDNSGTVLTQNSQPSFVSTIGVGGATPAASGAGITFPASQSASTDANTLDDYEEGTWSASISDGTNSVSVGVFPYTKVGNLVLARFGFFNISFSSLSAGVHLRVANLPFVIQNSGFDSLAIANVTNNNPVLLNGQANTNYALLYQGTSGSGIGTLVKGDLASTNGSFWGNIVYQTN